MEGIGNGLNFECSMEDDRVLELERKVKYEIRKCSINVPTASDVERYSSRLLTDGSLKKMFDVELMSSELSGDLQEERGKGIEDIGESESSTREEEEFSNTKESEEVDDDYVSFYNEEDELVTEKNEESIF